jgi:hypothetical protein
MRNSLIILAASAVMAGCTQAPPPGQGAAAADTRLEALIAGKVAGPPVSCLPSIYNSTVKQEITSTAIAFVASPGLVYVNDVRGSGCEGTNGPMDSLVRKSHGSDLCSGDIVEIRDLQANTSHGSCSLSAFVPYQTAGSH